MWELTKVCSFSMFLNFSIWHSKYVGVVHSSPSVPCSIKPAPTLMPNCVASETNFLSGFTARYRFHFALQFHRETKQTHAPITSNTSLKLMISHVTVQLVEHIVLWPISCVHALSPAWWLELNRRYFDVFLHDSSSSFALSDWSMNLV